MTAAVSIRRFRLPLDESLRSDEADRRDGFAIAVRSDRYTGVGEATPRSGWTEELSTCRDHLDSIAGFDDEAWRLPLPGGLPATRHGIQLAVADFAARADGSPLATYLAGDRARSAIPVNATIGPGTPRETSMQIEAAIAAGFETVKVKVGGASLSTTFERLEALGEFAGEVTIRLDANRAWDLEDANRVLKVAAANGVHLIEEPVAEPTPERLRSIDRHGVEVAIDETVAAVTVGDLEAWLNAIDAVLVKPMTVGGLDRSIEIAACARRNDVSVIISNTVDGVVARAGAAHLAAALGCTRAAGLATGHLLAADLADDVVPVENGRITIPSDPGIGTLGPWDRSARSEVVE